MMSHHQPNVFRRFSHSMAKMLRVNKSHSTQNVIKDENPANQKEDFSCEPTSPDLLRDQQILTSNSATDFRRTVILNREPNQSFGFSLQSVLIEKANEDKAAEKITFVSKVEVDSPADIGGIVPGDIIVAIDGEVVVDYGHADLISLIQTKTQMRVIVIFENMAKKVELISKYNQTEKLLAEKKKKLAEVNDQIEDILCRQDSEGSQGKSGDDDGAFLSCEDSAYSDIASGRFSLKSIESLNFDDDSVHFC